jgi:hypothetical protein
VKLHRQSVRRPGSLGLGIAAALGALLVHDAARAADCPPSLQALFSCRTGTKTIAVCGSPALSTTSGVLQYRFGSASKMELSFPPAGADWRTVTRGGTLMFSGGGGAFLAFSRAPYRYVVYSAVGRGWGSKAGVVVEKEGKRIASLACDGEARSQLGPDLFTRAGIATVDDFELP